MHNPNDRVHTGQPGRPRTAMKRVRLHIQLNEDLHQQLEEVFKDPLRDRIKCGSISNLCNALIADWLKQREKKHD